MARKFVRQQCPECGQDFSPYNNRKNVIFCSYRCQVTYNVRQRRTIRSETLNAHNPECPWCNKVFTPSRSNQAFCSDSCRSSMRDSQSRIKSIVDKQKIVCEICGAEFVPKMSSAKYCSPSCRQKAHADGARNRHQKNPVDRNAYQVAYRKKNNDSVRNYRLKNWYGITLKNYNDLLTTQQHKCAICGVKLEDGRGTHLDHEHGFISKVRGILCSSCNLGLGAFRDDTTILSRAIKYIERWRT